MNEKQKILIVDDEEDICEILQFNLQNEGYTTEIAFSAEEVLTKNIESFDLILLDVMMEKMSGFKLAEKIRTELLLKIPIIFLTAKTTENNLLTGFSVGGDDYIKKPFSINEVTVRIKAVLKRYSKKNTNETSVYQFEGLVLDYDNKTVKIDKKKIALTKKEFEILALFVKKPEKIFSRDGIMRKVWNYDTFVSDRTVDVHITRIRKKIGKYGKYIISKTGYGYSFEPT